MDRKTVFAIVLMLIVAIAPSFFFPSEQVPVPPPEGERTFDENQPDAILPAAGPVAPDTDRGARAVSLEPVPSPTSINETQVVVTSPLYRYTFSSIGARLVAAEMVDHLTLAVGDSGGARVIPPGSNFMNYRMVFGTDTLVFADWNFEPSEPAVNVGMSGTRLGWVARRGLVSIEVVYEFDPETYLFEVDVKVDGIGGGAGYALIGMGPRLGRTEKDSVGNVRSFTLTTRGRSLDNIKFSSLDPGEIEAVSGPFDWISLRSKYFVSALLTIEEGQSRIGGVVAIGRPRDGGSADELGVVASLPAPGGRFSHSVFVGPQEFHSLLAIGHDFEDVNPFGGFLRPVVSPFAKIVVRVLVWMHENLNMAYGWVLVTFGVAVRLILWPLNQKAMRSSMAMQAVQPEIKALQERYKGDPKKMQSELMKLYKEHGVNPIGGCLPSLIPMPVLFALFFVFQNSIELRGVSFFWLTDLAGPDPLFITPIIMAGSMYVLFKIGQIGVPPNPQMKMMLYVMPVMMLVFGIKFPAGLNVYYGVSNLASLPQQWFIAQERLNRAGNKLTDKT